MTVSEVPFEKLRRKMVTARIAFMGQLARFNLDELERRPAKDMLSPLQLAYNLYIVDGLALEQMRRVQEEDNPLIEPLPEQIPCALDTTSEIRISLESVLASMATHREELFVYLANLSGEGWQRPFRHREFSQLKFDQLVSRFPIHDQQHTRRLVTLKSAGNIET